jgi:PST family polysaccharide transporter
MTIFNIASSLGLANVLVTERNLDTRMSGTLLTMTVASGAVVALILVAAAPGLAALFGDPRLEGIMAAVAPIVLITSFTWFYDSLLQRQLLFGRRLVALTVENATYAAVALGLAFGGAGYWSLVGGQLAAVSAAALAFIMLAPARPRPGFHPTTARRALSSGSGFLLQSGFGFVQQNTDFIVVGKVLGPTKLGLYSAAYRMGELPYSGIADPVSRVTFPAFARMHGAGEAVAGRFLHATRIVVFVSAPIGILMSATAHPFVETVLGPEWLAMAPALTIFGVWAVVRSIEGSVAWCLNAIGEARIVGLASGALLGPLVGGIVLAALVGITAVAGVILLHAVILLATLAVAVQRRVGIRLTTQLRSVRGVALAAAAAWCVAASASRATKSSLSPAATLLIGASLGLLAYMIVVLCVDRGLVDDSLKQVKSIRRRSSPSSAKNAPVDAEADASEPLVQRTS